MRKNIRRSLVLAAAASGIWALGAASANAAELPTHDTGALTNTVNGSGGLLGNTLHGVTHTVGGVQHTVTKTTKTVGQTSGGLTQGATGKLAGSAASKVTGTVSGVTGQLPATGSLGNAGQLGKAADLNNVTKTAQHEVSGATKNLPVASKAGNLNSLRNATDLTNHVLPAEGLPSLPQVPGLNVLGQLPHLPAVPAVPQVGHVASHVVSSTLRPGQLTSALPAGPAKQVVVRTLPVAQQAVSDAGATVDNATSTTTPFANLAVGQADFLVHNPSPSGVVSAGSGLAGGVAPFALKLGAGVTAHVQTLAGHAVTGAQNGGIVPGNTVSALPSLPAVPAV
jgi:hypothetical protein